MDSTITSVELTQAPAARAVAVPVPDDSLGFFQALWFWIPAGLAMWSGIVWGITRFF
jgi:hypothetical protein